MLRHKEATSNLEELSSGKFFNVLDETDDLSKSEIKRIILCLGKVYYDLRAARRERKISSIAIIRIEQIYPFPHEDLLAILSKYPNIEDIVWCQRGTHESRSMVSQSTLHEACNIAA